MTTTYTDIRLTADLASSMNGTRRQAEILLTVPEDVRDLIVRDAHRAVNMIGGRPSDQLEAAAQAWRNGYLTEETFAAQGRALWGNEPSSYRFR